MKNIALFCDGTWQNLTQPYPTNVSRLARCVLPMRPASADQPASEQSVFYDDGVGVGTGVFNDLTRLVGGGLGEGLDQKIAEAYQFLCLNYDPGDHIYIFGFSRGAYTARSLSGLLRKCWILRRENVMRIDEAINHYRSGDLENAALSAFRSAYCFQAQAYVVPRSANLKEATAAIDQTSAHVQYVGVWDTVGSLGIPSTLPFALYVNGKYRFHDESLSKFVLSARHAVSIDERRNTFKPTLWNNIAALNDNASAKDATYADRPYLQSWFPGRHSGVGGGEDDGGLSDEALLWVAEGAIRAGLSFDSGALINIEKSSDPCADFLVENWSASSAMIALMGMSDRAGPDAFEDVSASARTRWLKRTDYRSPPIRKFAQQIEQLRGGGHA